MNSPELSFAAITLIFFYDPFLFTNPNNFKLNENPSPCLFTFESETFLNFFSFFKSS
jgi:hypothetical protein